MKKFEKKLLGNQGGFTLIEIIAVLVILGILAAVAVPKFMDLTDDANEKAFEGAAAAAFSNATLSYSRFVLRNDAAPNNINNTPAWTDGTNSVTIEDELGDYTIDSISYNGSATPPVLRITVEKTETSVTFTKSFNLP
ncbi:type II secretion system protein [Desulfosudis oleivorans]|uniref:Prepilin-type N-terminal cleavage/methylation domain-containing protein n=1 Tax=Desulfosudis oleivorans (strain DSM 6200 / JCM 39069 / Hxd3) TaxID=96561 RepID=A8ZYV9_DESOH|nr:type II secretion system protein [Desulfosudis oleivorans]ABW67214.1 hypothetical protein Dole_1410 [Desulfosudis oleivorans Hxd3]